MRLIIIFMALALLMGGAMATQTKIRPDQINTSMGWGVKLTNVTNGTAAQDAATFGQLPKPAADFTIYQSGSTWYVQARNSTIVKQDSSASVVLQYLSTTYRYRGYVSASVLGNVTLPVAITWYPTGSKLEFTGLVTCTQAFGTFDSDRGTLIAPAIVTAGNYPSLNLTGQNQRIDIGSIWGAYKVVVLDDCDNSNIHINDIYCSTTAAGTFGLGAYQAQFNTLTLNSIYGGLNGIYIGGRPAANGGTGVGENKFLLGTIGGGGMDYGINLNSSTVWMEGNQFYGTIFACDVYGMWLQSGGDHAYTMFHGVIDCIGGEAGSIDLLDQGTKNVFVMSWLRSDKYTVSKTSYLLNQETKSMVMGGNIMTTNTDGTKTVTVTNDGSIEIYRSDAIPLIDFKDNSADDFDARIKQGTGGILEFYTSGSGTRRGYIDSTGWHNG